VSYFPYRLINWLVLPVWLVHTLWRALRDGGKPYVSQRLGYYPKIQGDTKDTKQPGQPDLVWIHAASVGEVNTVAPLIRQLHNDYPGSEFLLTTITPTGRHIAEAVSRSAGINPITFAYLPLDYPFAVRRFLSHYQPRIALVVETEIWPTLYAECTKADIPLLIVNGRQVSCVLAKSADDADGFRALLDFHQRNASVEHPDPTPGIHVCGNLKRWQPEPATGANNSRLENVLAARNANLDPPLCLLASTHEDEEVQLVREWIKHQREELLVIVPRHPERGKTIETRLKKLGCNCCRRSESQDPDKNTDVYIADTLGELEDFYRICPVVFVGGSITAIGGHNVLEPARSGCAIVVGPHMANFAEELAQLESHDAIVRNNGPADVVTTLCELLDNPLKRDALREHTLVALQPGDQSTDSADEFSPGVIRQNYLEHLEPWLK